MIFSNEYGMGKFNGMNAGKEYAETFGEGQEEEEGITESDRDLISRQAVKDLIRGLTRWCVRSQDGKFNNVGLLYDDVMFGIDRLPSAEKTAEWTPVNEELPKYNKTVLISVKQKGKEATVFTAQRRRRVKTPDIFECCTDNDGWWDLRISAWDDHKVVAWMPLPKPYKTESEDDE